MESQLLSQPPISYKTLEETPFHLITKPEEIDPMIENLEKCKEIAIDLEVNFILGK